MSYASRSVAPRPAPFGCEATSSDIIRIIYHYYYSYYLRLRCERDLKRSQSVDINPDKSFITHHIRILSSTAEPRAKREHLRGAHAHAQRSTEMVRGAFVCGRDFGGKAREASQSASNIAFFIL